jgi:hypothetical protein
MSNNDFIKEFSRSKIAFVKTLINFKTTDNGEKEVAKPLLSKLSLSSLKLADSRLTSEKTTIIGFTLSGSTKSLTRIKDTTKSTSASQINLEEQKKIVEAIKAKTDSITDPVAKQKAIDEEIQKSMPADVKNQLSNQPKLDLTETQIKEVDKLVKKDISGNNFIDHNEIKSKVKLTDEQTKQVQVAMNSYNSLPVEIKDGTSQATSKILETNTQKVLTKDQASTTYKILSYVKDFGGVKADAYWCNSYATQFEARSNWWGVEIINTTCGWWASGAYTAGIAFITSITAATLCAAISFGWCSWPAIIWVQNTLAGYLTWRSGGLGYKALTECGGEYWGRSKLVVGYWNFWRGGDDYCN